MFGIFASGTLSSLPFYLSRDMRNTCSFYRNPEKAPIADGLDRTCQSEAAASDDQVPLTQFLHLESLSLPCSLEYFPGTQALQYTESDFVANPSSSLYRPTSQHRTNGL